MIDKPVDLTNIYIRLSESIDKLCECMKEANPQAIRCVYIPLIQDLEDIQKNLNYHRICADINSKTLKEGKDD